MELFITLLVVSDIVILSLLVYGWRRRDQTIGRLFIYVMCCLLIWVSLAIFEYLSASLSVKLFWADLSFIGITLMPVFWFLLVIEYTGKQEQWQRYRSWLFVIPAIINVLIWTNEWHHWWRGVSIIDEINSAFLLVDYDYQFAFYIHAVYGYMLFILSTIILIQKMRVTKSIYRHQITLLLLSTSLPMISDTLYIFGLSPIPNFNFTPIIFSFSGILLAISLFRHQFLDLMPVARNKLIENMNDAMLVLDAKNRIVDLNPSMLVLLNMRSEQAIGSVADPILNEWGISLGREWKTAVSHQEIMIERNGIQTYYDLHTSSLSTNETTTGCLILLRDISHRVQLENDLRLKNEDLEAFSHMVAHDLKNPLATIIQISELLPHLLPTDEVSDLDECLDILRLTTNKMSSIINELLLLAQIRQQKIIVKPTNMAIIIAEVLGRLRYAIKDKKAVIIQPDEWPDVITHAPWIEEVWVNYISNGLKYGGHPPHLTLGFTKQNDGTIRFWVQDNGAGIAPADHIVVFSAFTRLDVGDIEGHGLGLSIVSRIITNLGGEVGVESGQGDGSLFYFTLPDQIVRNEN